MRKILSITVAALLLAACNENEDHEKENTTTEQVEKQEGVTQLDESLLGKWQGMIEIPQAPLEIILDLQTKSGSLSVPVQGLSEYPFESIDYKDQTISIVIDLAGSLIKIMGKSTGEVIEGTFTQNGQTFPLTLKPYIEVTITYDELLIPVTGGELKVALQMPKSPTGELAILHAGSGPTNKDGNTLGGGQNNSLKMIAEALAEQGIATIRFDKRGIGDNTSLIAKEEDLTLDAYVKDVGAIIAYVKQDEGFNDIHLVGHSEGALIMTLAAQSNDVASLITLAGAGRPVDEILIEQLTASLPINLLTEAKSALEKLKAGEKITSVSPQLQSLFRPSVQPYMMSWLKYDPQKELSNVTVPILVVQGKNDIQVTEVDANNLKAANENAILRYFENMNHVLKDVEKDQAKNIASYSNPDLPLTSGLIEEMTTFIK